MPSDRVDVGLFVTSFDHGGTESQMLELARNLDPDVFRVHLACFHRQGPLAVRAADLGASITEFPLISLRHPHTAAALLRFGSWCVRRRLAIVQTAGLYANIFGLAGAAIARVRFRVGSGRSLASLSLPPGLCRLQRCAYRLAHRVVANSSAAAAALADEGVPPEAIVTIPNGIDVRGRPVSLAPGSPRVVVVANLRAEKGHDVLIAAARRVLASRPDVAFQLVGDGPLRAEIERTAERQGVARAFEFLGFRDDVPRLLAAAGLFVLPSRTEAMPNAVMEAMAARLPIVATAVGGVPELIRHGHDGVLVPPGRPDELANAILAIVADPSRARQLGDAAGASVERFTIDRMVLAYEQLYVGALDSVAARSGRPLRAFTSSNTRIDVNRSSGGNRRSSAASVR